ncbi:PadR family transcriptional regulator [Streptomyces sp. WM6378]|uniref:PadR family transcriptional regulator n=1 Tax=Streptomyces sp. WM6378 TaxID=1415557 RepID=UPI0006AED904|nr:PadR family transcriptional regulator [Streptomyces sp. WM6378]KOU52449.1 PadR family transcriptional regulator [Streptomyces sp. WM6378]
MSLRHAVLGLLTNRPASGYDLMKLFETSLAHVWSATQSQVYGELGKLADGGLVEVSAEGPRGRKEYAITESGRSELRRWLTEVEPVRTRRSDSLLRVFFLGELTRVEAKAYLLGEAERSARQLAGLKEAEAVIDWGEDPISVHGRLAMEYGKRLNAMHEEWARWAAERLAP